VFSPLEEKKVRLYVCGITPYDTTHVGHAFTYISFDLLVRVLGFLGYTVSYTQNVTDINDRDNDILRRAREQNTTWDKLAAFWTKKFLTDMETLNWITPTNYLKASEHIPSMIALIENIIHNGFGYVVNGGVYVDIQKVTDFGKLSKLPKEKMLEKAKEFEEDVENKQKRHPLDITLWRPASSHQPVNIPSFNSPWGKGRPGWHIECSAMAIESLGEQIDIHGGGIDLLYPHHESEIAQSEGATLKKPFATYWLHTGTVYIRGEKMSKSLGNLVLVSDLLKTYSPNAIRYVLLSHHYRHSWEYKEEEFIKAETLFENITTTVKKNPTRMNYEKNYMQVAKNLLVDDLNAPLVLEEIAQVGISNEMVDILRLLGFTF